MLDALMRLREIAESSAAQPNPTSVRGADLPVQPKIARTWLTEAEAVELTGRSRWTIRDWRLGGLLTCQSGYGARMYRRDELIAVRDAQAENYRRGVTRPRHPRVPTCAGQLALAV
ncbi:hypothetical protein NN4_64700 [Nocardia ninae NBRC 108245]|uniref:Helix-turn-helix domain-containing protein n=1 Tax=Nocardia ninae NBRC 108245 TaxID=1210091 RepID=A0A511MNC3_9NOCA|nr:hypothetical protein NN4_64700 [Nocardia ninae NBRC 108245]